MKTNPNDTTNVVFNNMGSIRQGGLTKREYFAAMAMQGILSNASGIKEPGHWTNWAVKYADDLIAELNKEVQGE